ncbi:MAG: PhaM family polyhydroxyalkanoate granule multifunctional regulatory protein, partial [Betaproteobacteria bacterium]
MSDIPSFAKLVPGFDFLQGLVKNAGSALPSMGQWVAPTLNPEELQKRIDELKTVQFWLEQNARMLGTTIQALEVQRMTLSTLKTMNVQMTDLRDAMKVAPVASAGSAASAAVGSVANSFGADALMQAARNAMGGIAGLAKPAAPAPEPEPAPEPPAPAARPAAKARAEAAEAPAVAASGVV